eukprot:2794437-Pyramimonas_sp.AAC.1
MLEWGVASNVPPRVSRCRSSGQGLLGGNLRVLRHEPVHRSSRGQDSLLRQDGVPVGLPWDRLVHDGVRVEVLRSLL